MAKLGLSHPPHAASCFVAYLSSGGAQALRPGEADQLSWAKARYCERGLNDNASNRLAAGPGLTAISK
jgi:hypothetical protein